MVENLLPPTSSCLGWPLSRPDTGAAQVFVPRPFGLHDYTEVGRLADEKIPAQVLAMHARFIGQPADWVQRQHDEVKAKIWWAEAGLNAMTKAMTSGLELS